MSAAVMNQDERFDRAIIPVLRHEGGLVNDVHDSGGITHYGISLRFLQQLGKLDPFDGYLLGDMDHDGDIDADDIRLMDIAEATRIYRLQWWDRYGYARISYDPLAFKVFDLAINMGGMQAHKLLQRAIIFDFSIHLKIDGVLGINTLTAINRCDGAALLAAFKERAIGFYRSLRKPRFEAGWIRRVKDD